MLDLLSDGRAIFSAGRGYDKREYDAFAIPFAESRARFDEEMQLVRTAWTEEEFTFAGKYHQVREPLTVLPRPVQQPHPPIYVACFSRPTVEMAARNGFNAIFAPFAATMMFGSLQDATAEFKDLAREAGHPTAGDVLLLFLPRGLARRDARAKERLLYYLHGILPAFPADRRTAPPHIATSSISSNACEHAAPGFGRAQHRDRRSGAMSRDLEAGRGRWIEEVILYFNFGGYSHADTMRMMERFAREVMPHFVGQPGGHHARCA